MAFSNRLHPQNDYVPDGKREVVIKYKRVDGNNDEDDSTLRLLLMYLTRTVNHPELATNQAHCVRHIKMT